MNREEFIQGYKSRQPLFGRILKNVSGAICDQLNAAGVPYLNIENRIKTLDSAFEKVGRKNYNDPFNQIEDFCGIRIVCYYPGDVDKIVRLLCNEFDVISEENTQARLKPNEFGYRSTHLILTIPTDWLRAPEYRGLNDLKVEVQTRTILMHAWAEIQHKLAYKSADQVPDDFQRRLFRLSAKFEEADEQLEQIRDDLSSYRSEVRNIVDGFASLKGQPLNLDTLTILLDAAFPERVKSVSANSEILTEILELSLTMDDLIDAIQTHAPISAQLESLDTGNGEPTFWVQVGALRSALDVANEAYYTYRMHEYYDTEEWREPTEFGRDLLKNSSN